VTQPDSAGKLQAIAIVLYAIDVVFLGAEKYARGPVDVAELIGALLGPIIFMIVFVAIARLFKRATSQRGAAKVAVGTMALFAVGSFGGLLTAVSSNRPHPADAAARLVKGTIAGAGYLPKKVDSVTMFRGVEAHGDTVVYYYQLNMTADDFHKTPVHAFRVQLIDRACNNTAQRTNYLSQGVVFRYRYTDLVDRELTSIYVTEAICSASGAAAPPLRAARAASTAASPERFSMMPRPTTSEA